MEFSNTELEYLYSALLDARDNASIDLDYVTVHRPLLAKARKEALVIYEQLVLKTKQELGLDV